MILEGANSAEECNERLEFLGDAVLGSIIGEFLFKKYPHRSEGYLTEMRSKIVGRNSLNAIGNKIGLDKILEYNNKAGYITRSVSGNTFEALVGALYLDVGYYDTKKFLFRRFLRPHFVLEELEEQNLNFKSQLLEYLQKKQSPLAVFVLTREGMRGNQKEFTIECQLGNEVLGTGIDTKKKNAEQKAAEQAFKLLMDREKAREIQSKKDRDNYFANNTEQFDEVSEVEADNTEQLISS